MLPTDPDALPRHEMSPGVRLRLREQLVATALSDTDRDAESARARSISPRRGPARAAARHRRPLTALVVGGCAAALAVVVVVAEPGGSSAWAAVPDRLTGTGLAAAQADCAQALRKVQGSEAPDRVVSVLGERRGSTSSVVIAGPSSLGVCIGTGTTRLDGVVDLDPVGPRSRLTVDGQPGVMNGDSPTRVIVGRVGAEASKVSVSTTDGREVTASVASGYYLAWWPSGADVRTVTALGSDGAVLARVTPEAINPGGQPPAPRNS